MDIFKLISTEVSGDGIINRVSLSWGVREAESQGVRDSESQGVSRVSLNTL